MYTIHPFKCFLGYLQYTAEWPFTVYFFREQQLDHFSMYCKAERYTYLYVDATGSVIKKLQDQKQCYFYTMIFKAGTDPSNTLPLGSALLCDHSAVSITSYFNFVRSKLALRCKTARPSFVVIDFSAALLNSVLGSFNTETVRGNLRRCFNTLNFAYDSAQLHDMTFVRLCCSHVMKAFSRSLAKVEKSKEARRRIMTLFAVLLNCYNMDGAFDLYEVIMKIYADPFNEESSRSLSSLFNKSCDGQSLIEQYLDVDEDEDEDEPHFLDEIDITVDPIIHQSPFNVKACNRIPVLNAVILKQPVKKTPTNPLFSIKLVQLFHKWFAYLPMWSGIMTEFVDRYVLFLLKNMILMIVRFRYANDGKHVSTDGWEFGRGRISNASVESYFAIIKQSVLLKKTRLRPATFLLKVYLHTDSRLKANKLGVTQTSRSRKTARDRSDNLNSKETWSRKGRSLTKPRRRSRYFSRDISQTTACRLGYVIYRMLQTDYKLHIII